jgi:hypothetical protein
MKNQSYSTSIEVTATPTDVFNHINEVSKWWIKDFEGKSTDLNDEFSVRVPGQHYSKHKLVEVIPNKKVVWLVTKSKLDWIEKNKGEWTNTQMVFEIIPKGDKTVLNFTHEGLFPEQECYSMCVQVWNMLMKESLYNFITDGDVKSIF